MTPKRLIAGFSLVEITLALGVTAFCLLSILALLPIGLTTNRGTVQQTLAANLLSAIAADLRNTPKAEKSSPEFGISLDGTTTRQVDETGRSATTDARFRIVVAPAGTPDNGAAWLRVSVAWPAHGTNPEGSVDAFVAVDRH
jgi:uncharacterized protein (TIGR02598 family)